MYGAIGLSEQRNGNYNYSEKIWILINAPLSQRENIKYLYYHQYIMKQIQVERAIREMANGVSPLRHYFSNEKQISDKAMDRIEAKLRAKA